MAQRPPSMLKLIMLLTLVYCFLGGIVYLVYTLPTLMGGR